MADMKPVNVPKPPDVADINSIHQWIRDFSSFYVDQVQNGRLPFLSQNQINKMNSLEQAGTIFFNNDTGKAMIGEVSGGALSVKTVTTS